MITFTLRYCGEEAFREVQELFDEDESKDGVQNLIVKLFEVSQTMKSFFKQLLVHFLGEFGSFRELLKFIDSDGDQREILFMTKKIKIST